MERIITGVPVKQLMKEVSEHPELWDQYDIRTKFYEDSPHRETHDIWLRYRDYSEFDPENPKGFSDQHESMWYASYYKLPAVKTIIDRLKLNEIGGVLITKIPSGCKVYKHNDKESWHAKYFFKKYLVVLQSAPEQTFCFDNEEFTGSAGDVFLFDNLQDHWVTNDSAIDRLSLIITERPLEVGAH